MSWLASLARRAARTLEAESRSPWLLRTSRLRSSSIELAADGPFVVHGEQSWLDVALAAGDAQAHLSLAVHPGQANAVGQRLSRWLAEVGRGRSAVSSAKSPTIEPGSSVDWSGRWLGLAQGWTPRLEGALRSARGQVQSLQLDLERREERHLDHRRREARSIRHFQKLRVTAAASSSGPSWSLTVPLEKPQPHELGAHVERGIEHAAIRASGASLSGSRGPVWLGPTAAAQLLAGLPRAREESRAAAHEPDEDDAKKIVTRRIREQLFPDAAEVTGLVLPEIEGTRWPLPARALSILPGGAAPSEGASLILAILDREHDLGEQAELLGAGTVQVPGQERTSFSACRVVIPWRALLAALEDPDRRGDEALGTRLGAFDLFVPHLFLGERTWRSP